MHSAQFYVDEAYQLDEVEDLMVKCSAESERLMYEIHEKQMKIRELKHEIHELEDLRTMYELKNLELYEACSAIKRELRRGEA